MYILFASLSAAKDIGAYIFFFIVIMIFCTELYCIYIYPGWLHLYLLAIFRASPALPFHSQVPDTDGYRLELCH